MNIRDETTRLGYKIVYVSNETIGEHLACYHVEFEGKIIRPRTALKLGIPINEIWISEQLKQLEDRILFHELQEIRYRRQGYNSNKAHKKARKDEIRHYGE